jgi:ribonuclease P protein component
MHPEISDGATRRDRPRDADTTPTSKTHRKTMVEEARSEAYVPAEHPPPGEAARVPAPDVDTRGPASPAVTSAQGTASPVGLIWRVRDRASFVALRREGYRVRQGPVTVTFLAEAASVAEAEPPRVAFAVGRRVGGAVRRNRVRRQLRAIMRELVARPDTVVGPGTYLLSTRPEVTTLTYQELKKTVEQALAQIPAARRVAREGA